MKALVLIAALALAPTASPRVTGVVAHAEPGGDSHGHNGANDGDDEVDDPVTERGPNKGTKMLKDTLGTVEGKK